MVTTVWAYTLYVVNSLYWEKNKQYFIVSIAGCFFFNSYFFLNAFKKSRNSFLKFFLNSHIVEYGVGKLFFKKIVCVEVGLCATVQKYTVGVGLDVELQQ